MAKRRILIVDDAVVVRRVVADVLAGDPALEVVGTAANGRIALAKLDRLNPDLVVLDLEMPEMDGLQTLTALRQTHPRLPVILFSRTGRPAATVEALARGASDYVAIPDDSGGMAGARACIREHLIPRIKLFCARGVEVAAAPRPADRPGRPPEPGGQPRLPREPVARDRSRVEVVAVGVSTGGPNALAVLLSALPADLPVPAAIVQHMPPLFTRLLAERLAARSAIGVAEAVADATVESGHAWLAPGDCHMELARRRDGVRVALHQGPPENSCRPSVDVLFRAAAETYGPGVLAVVLTGMGQDGLRGCERVRDAGGQVLVQDEATSVVWGMPGAVARAGLADEVLALDQLGPEIVRRARHGRPRPPHGS
jgi:two-component system chemotaxis response regulator CheB